MSLLQIIIESHFPQLEKLTPTSHPFLLIFIPLLRKRRKFKVCSNGIGWRSPKTYWTTVMNTSPKAILLKSTWRMFRTAHHNFFRFYTTRLAPDIRILIGSLGRKVTSSFSLLTICPCWRPSNLMIQTQIINTSQLFHLIFAPLLIKKCIASFPWNKVNNKMT